MVSYNPMEQIFWNLEAKLLSVSSEKDLGVIVEDGWTDRWMDEWMDGWTDGWMDKRTGGRTDERTDRQTDNQASR